MFTKEDWLKYKKRGKCLRYNEQYKAASKKQPIQNNVIEEYLIIPEKDFIDIGKLYRFSQINNDFFQEKYTEVVGRRKYDKETKQYTYLLLKSFLAKELVRTELKILIDLASRLGNFKKELNSIKDERDKFIEYLFRRNSTITYQEIEEDDESLFL